MDAKTYIQQQMANVRRHVDAVVKDTTDEQFNWLPPGTINPISAILVHVLAGEDYFIQTVLQGKPRCWEAEGWGRKIGIQAPPEPGRGWDEFKTIKISVAPVLAYEQSIRVATDIYLADFSVEELNRQVNFAGNVLPAAEVLMTLVVHIASHAGEIAAVKGMQGIKGLPF
jgi:DinB superfamily